MMKLTRGQIKEMTNTFLLANTPKSLLRALLKSSVVDGLRRSCSNDELLRYYKRITAKGKRTPLVAAMAYATLIALLVKSPTQDQYPDASFLQWGQVIEAYVNQQYGTTQSLIIMPDSKPEVRLVSNNGNPVQVHGLSKTKITI